jgi:hypothetical protein
MEHFNLHDDNDISSPAHDKSRFEFFFVQLSNISGTMVSEAMSNSQVRALLDIDNYHTTRRMSRAKA